jgi:hypothetical protein
MASASLRHESCSYSEQLKQSVGPGMYMLERPANDYEPCARDIPADPHLRWQSWGPGFCEPGTTVDIGSELLGLNYKSTRCSSSQYSPYAPSAQNAASLAQSQCHANGNTHPRACMAPTESTRLSNPPCTLKCTGWNRWEWLCYNPQDTAIMPFDAYINYRIIAKDNHKPCLPVPQDQTNEVSGKSAKAAEAAVNTIHGWKPPTHSGASAPGNPYEKQMQSCNNLKAMGA